MSLNEKNQIHTSNGLKVLSLFDGMACGMLALMGAGYEVERYVAYEIDKYAIQTSKHNFPMIEHRGDVFEADFTEFKGFDMLIGGSPCFVAGTMVKTEDGFKPIESIKVGDKVLTHKGRYMPVKEIMHRITPSTVTVKTENCGTVECTSEHPFYTKDIVRKWNNDTRQYDRMLDDEFCWTDPAHFHTVVNNSGSIQQQTYVTSVTDGTKLVPEYSGVDIQINQYETKHVSSLDLTDKNIWYVIGRWLGDGWFKYKYKKQKKLSGVIICCGKHEVTELEDKLKKSGLTYYKNEERTTYRFTITNLEFALYLSQFGHRATDKHLYKDVYCLPDELACAFLDGYFDADGHISNHIGSYSTVSKELAYGIKFMINKYYHTACTIKSEINHSDCIEGRNISVNPIYTGLFHQSKQRQSHYIVEDNYIFAPYKSIAENSREVAVYNLSVEEDESYTANGLVVHNCTYWSIAQKNNRETEASGMGWELFSQYVRALHEAKPKYFVYENNKSMSKAIRASITETFGFEPICINSALVSAQNRQRLYWVGKREADGTYSRVDVEQPEDRRILLRDILETGTAWQDKSFAYTTRCQGAIPSDTLEKHRHTMIAEPVIFNTPHGYNKGGIKYDKSPTLTANGSWETNNFISEPVCVAQRGRYNEGGKVEQHYEPREDNKTNVITTVQKDNMVAEPVNTTPDGKSQTIKAQYFKNSVANFCGYTSTYGATGVAEPIRVGSLPRPNGELSQSQAFRIYDIDGKSVNINAGGGGAGGKTGLYAVPVCMRYERSSKAKAVRKDYEAGKIHHGFHELSELHPRADGKTNTLSTVLKDNPICEPVCYAEPCEWDENGRPTKAISSADGKTYMVYEVKNGIITIKGKEYPIKLLDGFYIIRKLTVRECMRLQTVPEWYEFPVSNAQAYKMLGNGWTVEVIKHLFESLPIN